MDFGEIVGKKYHPVDNYNGDIEVEKKFELEVDKKSDYGEIEVRRKYEPKDDKTANSGEIEVRKKYILGVDREDDHGDIEVGKKSDYGEIEVRRKYEPEDDKTTNSEEIEVHKKYILEVDREDDHGEIEVEKKSDSGEVEGERNSELQVEKKTDNGELEVKRLQVENDENADNTTNDECGGEENGSRNLVGERDTESSRNAKNSFFQNLSPGGSLIKRLTPVRQKRALAKIKVIGSRNRVHLDLPLNDDQYDDDQDIATSTSDSQTAPNVDTRTSPEVVGDDDSSEGSIGSEHGDMVGSLKHIGARRHVGMAGLYASGGPSRPRPRSRPALTGPPPRQAMVGPPPRQAMVGPPPRQAMVGPPPRKTRRRLSVGTPKELSSPGAKTTRRRLSVGAPMEFGSPTSGRRKVLDRRDLITMQSPRKSPRKQRAQINVQNFQDYLKMQQINSVERFDNTAWNLNEPEEEEKLIDIPFQSILSPGPDYEESEEFSIGARPLERNSSTRRIASTQGITHLAQSADWFEFLEHVNDDDDDDDDDDDLDLDELDIDNDQDVRTPFYSRPSQRQRWAAKQVLPHVNWGDLFFDLFFVSMAANLGNMVVGVLQKPANVVRGIIYFVGCFGPLFHAWENKTKYQARYTVNDHFHQIFDIARIFVIGFAVLHIKSLDLFADPKSVEMGVFTFCLSVDSILSFFVNLELYFLAKGDRRAIQTTTKHKMIQNAIFETPYLIATILAAIFFWSDIANDTEKKELYLWRLADLPLTLCCVSYLMRVMTQIGIMIYHNRSKKIVDFQNRFVPHNIEFLIQRYREWVMLMIGENVLALLIVETIESVDYYIVTSIGVVTVTTLHFLKHESDPRKPSRHALLRGTSNGLFYSVCVQIFSMTLIAFGVSLRIFLEAILRDFNQVPYEIADSAVATLHCMTLAVLLFSLELIHMSHSSSENGRSGFMFCKHEQLSVSVLYVVSAICKTVLLLYTATLPFWNNNPVFVSVSSSVVTGFFALSRVITTNYQLMSKRKRHSEKMRMSKIDDDISIVSSSQNSDSFRLKDDKIVSA